VLTSVEIENFRCIKHAKVDFASEGTGIVGPNASGKTSFLEAIYFLAQGRSFRTNTRGRLIGPASNFARIVSNLDQDGRSLVAGTEFTESNTRVRVAGRDESSVSAIAALLPVQIIDPGVHRLVEEGSARRRRMLDWGVFHVEHPFLLLSRRYQRALAQRNAALRSSQPMHLVHSWDAELASTATSIDESRAAYVDALRRVFGKVAHRLLGVECDLQYFRGWAADVELGTALANATERDLRLRTTTVGPHRADVAFKVEGGLARERVSRGQQKMLASAFVLSQIIVAGDRANRRTCLLLDDPAAELDVDNLGKLLGVIAEVPAQLIVTSLGEAGLKGMQISRMFHVEQGSFTSMI
jgi:DNA replication and repair protein RecF